VAATSSSFIHSLREGIDNWAKRVKAVDDHGGAENGGRAIASGSTNDDDALSAGNTAIQPQEERNAGSSPALIGAVNWRATIKRTSEQLVRHRISMSAGSLAYHWFLAIFPAIIAILGFLSFVRLDAHGVTSLTHAFEKGLPSGVAGVFRAAVTASTTRKSGSVGAVVIGIVVAIWSASGGMSALQQALDVAYNVPVDRKFLARRVHAIPLMAATLVLGGAGAGLAVLGAPIGAGIEGHVPVHGTTFLVLWTIVRWAITFVAISALFAIFYYSGPNRKTPRIQWLSIGGVLATVAFLLVSLAFSFYVTRFGSYGKTYGAFAGVAILIFWLYLTALAVLAGGELNADIERQAVQSHGRFNPSSGNDQL
jgi:membrane protein